MSALTRIRTLPKPAPKTRDIERPIYPRRIAVEVTGISRDVLRQWQFRGLLDHVRWNGVLIRQKRHGHGRRFYSVLDLIKLSVMAELVSLGTRVEIAAEAPALIEQVLSGDDRDALEHGRIPEHPLLFAKATDPLELAYFVSLSGMRSPCASAEIALRESPVCAGLLIDWPGIVGRVFGELEEIDQRMGRV